MRKILVLRSAYVRTSIQTLGEGEGSPKATRPGAGGGEIGGKSCGAFGQPASLLKKSFL